MHNQTLRHALTALVLVVAFLFQGTMGLAQSTTGNISGSVVDDTGKPISGATVQAVSPSQTGSATTAASGRFTLLSLAPDTYTVSVSAPGYAAFSQPGVTVLATQTVNVSLGLQRSIQKIGTTTARAPSQLVHPGVTSEVYNVNAATQTAVQGLGGGNNIDNAYSAIVSTPGTYVAQGANGWGQTIFIHGADYAQVGYQYDGIPINRAFDNYNSNTLTNLGQQELQVFTGGAPPDSNSQTVGGYINQVIKTGTYPAYRSLQFGVGTSTFYNQGRFETGGATANRNFSYYLGLSNYLQSFRYETPFNGGMSMGNNVANTFNGYSNNLYYGFGVVPYCGPGGTDPAAAATGGDPGCNTLFPWNSGGLQRTTDQEGVLNLHFGIPHRSGLRDDVQLLGSVSHLTDKYYTSVNDMLPGLQGIFQYYGVPTFGPANYPTYHDGVTFPGGTQPLQPVATLTTNVNCFSKGLAVNYVPYLYPSSPTGRTCNSAIDPNHEDGVQVDTGITKLQYQHAFNQNSFVRLYGYTDYSDWLQNGPYLAAAVYGGYLGSYYSAQAAYDYELDTHTRGASLNYVNQINARNLVEFTANYTTATTMRYNNTTFANTPGTAATNLVSSANGVYTCYNAAGAPGSCFSGSTRGSFGNPAPFAATGAAAAAGAQWLVTDVGPTGTYNTVVPHFSSYALTDQMNVTDKLLLNFGLRLEQYQYSLVNLTDPIHNFWYQAAQSSLCYNPVSGLVEAAPLPKGSVPPPSVLVATACPVDNGVQTLHPNGQNGAVLYTGQIAGNISRTAFEPRISGTYTLDRDDVLRVSFGKYSQPVQTAYVEYNNLNPSSLTGAGGSGANFNLFYPLGFNTPEHDLPPAISYNSDASFEHQFRNSDVSISVSPFYRRTLNQYQTVVIGPNFASAFPAANQNSFGYEIALRKGDPSREGFSGQISYTYTKTGIQFPLLPTGSNAIDNINYYIQAFNALTAGGTVNNPYVTQPKQTGSPCYLGGTPYAGCTISGSTITVSPAGLAAGAVINPYYFMNPQPILNRNATYPAFDTFSTGPPGYGQNATGNTLAPPQVLNGFVNYRHKRFTVTPSFQLAQPGYYGSPVAVPGLDPRMCPGGAGSNQAAVPTATNPGLPNYIACEGPSTGVNGGVLAIPNPETGKFDGFGAFVQPWVLGVNMQFGYDFSKNVHLNVLVANLYNRCFGGTSAPWSTGVTAPGSIICGYSASGQYVSNFYNGSSPNDAAANGTAVLPSSAHAYTPFAQPFQPLNIYAQLQFRL
jgi:hypothetical protein